MMIVATKSKKGWVAVSAKPSPVMWNRQQSAHDDSSNRIKERVGSSLCEVPSCDVE